MELTSLAKFLPQLSAPRFQRSRRPPRSVLHPRPAVLPVVFPIRNTLVAEVNLDHALLVLEGAEEPVMPREGGHQDKEEEISRNTAESGQHRVVEHDVANAREVGVDVERC